MWGLRRGFIDEIGFVIVGPCFVFVTYMAENPHTDLMVKSKPECWVSSNVGGQLTRQGPKVCGLLPCDHSTSDAASSNGLPSQFAKFYRLQLVQLYCIQDSEPEHLASEAAQGREGKRVLGGGREGEDSRGRREGGRERTKRKRGKKGEREGTREGGEKGEREGARKGGKGPQGRTEDLVSSRGLLGGTRKDPGLEGKQPYNYGREGGTHRNQGWKASSRPTM